MRRRRGAIFGALAGALVVTPAWAILQVGNTNISGTLYSQHALQHDTLDRFEYVQARNTFSVTLDHDFLYDRKLFGKLDFGFLDSVDLHLSYRASWDPIFRIRDRYDRRLDDERDIIEQESWLRELYLDLATRQVGPGRLSLRIGRQQVVWGEADVVRSLDVINPLDLRKNFLLGPDQPNLNEYRIPLWMLKGLYGWRDFGPISNPAFEFLWIPGDIQPLRGHIGEVMTFPFDQERRPSTLPHHRVRHPFEITRIGPGRTNIPAQAVLLVPGQAAGPLEPIVGDVVGPIKADLIWFDKDRPFDGIRPPKNDVPSRSWIDHAEVGARFLGQVAPFGRTVDFSLNYIYTYSDIPGAFADFPAVAAALFGSPGSRDPETGAGVTFEQFRDLGSQATIWIPAALEYPRTHIFGATATYSETDFTGAIVRGEVSHQTDDPRIKPKPPFLAEREGQFTLSDFEQNFRATGATTRMMLGADFFRSIPLLDPILGPGQPFFISGQWFLEYKENISNTIGTLLDVNDRQKRWNPLYTLLVQYFSKGGRWVTVFVGLYDQDPQHFAMMPSVEYHPRNWLTIKVGQIWFTGSKFRQSSRFLHTFADRDETFIRFQYEF